MSGEVGDMHGDVVVIRLDNPPVNGLGHALRSAVLAGVDAANEDAGVRAIVIAGAGKLFSAGADVREFGTPASAAEPTLGTVIRVLEASAKPVVAAIHGTCMGGGLELALGCHHRVARRDAQVALPEVKLGLIPGAGGTQRLPRAIGVERALGMIVSGATFAAANLADTALFDALVDGDPLDAAIALARRVADARGAPRRLRDVAATHPNAEAFFRFARTNVAAAAKGLPAPVACVDAVAASVSLRFDDGMRFERRTFLDLMASPQSRALRHAFFAERAAARIADVPGSTTARPVERVAVIGAGTMGAGIATAFADAGIEVVLVDAEPKALERGVAAIRAGYEGAVRKGRLAEAEVARRMARVVPTLSLDDIATADLVVEAVFEDMAVKRAVFAGIDRVAKPGAILATNTSTLDVDALARSTSRPRDVLGLHFFSPAHVMRLLEVVRGAATSPEALATAMKVAKRIGKTAVVSGVCDGFIGNRMVEHYLRQATFLVEEGASPAEVDAALERFGMAMGPFRMSDLAGLDVGWRIRQRRYAERPQVPWSRVGDRLCELGRFGQKTGAGWYRYEPGRRDALPDPAVDALVAAFRHERGIVARRIGDDEIVDRAILALVNEGARILDDGIAQRASDIDVVYLTGYGFPRHRGGPMLHADTVGLFNVARRLREFASRFVDDRAFWTPAPRLARLAAEGGTFNG